jgi:hypothetical protein
MAKHISALRAAEIKARKADRHVKYPVLPFQARYKDTLDLPLLRKLREDVKTWGSLCDLTNVWKVDAYLVQSNIHMIVKYPRYFHALIEYTMAKRVIAITNCRLLENTETNLP